MWHVSLISYSFLKFARYIFHKENWVTSLAWTNGSSMYPILLISIIYCHSILISWCITAPPVSFSLLLYVISIWAPPFGWCSFLSWALNHQVPRTWNPGEGVGWWWWIIPLRNDNFLERSSWSILIRDDILGCYKCLSLYSRETSLPHKRDLILVWNHFRPVRLKFFSWTPPVLRSMGFEPNLASCVSFYHPTCIVYVNMWS